MKKKSEKKQENKEIKIKRERQKKNELKQRGYATTAKKEEKRKKG